MFTLDDDIMRQLRATFKTEAAEHVQAINRILVALEKDPEEEERVALLEEIFREAHSLKGAAGAADFAEVEATAHRLESVMSAANDGEIELTGDLCDVLYDAVDAVGVIIEAALEDRSHGLDLPDLYVRLEAAEEGRIVPRAEGGEQEAGGSEPSSPAEPPPRDALREPEAQAPEAGAPHLDSEPQPARRPKITHHASRITSSTEETIRVATGKIDSLMTQAGELLVAGLKIDQRMREVEEISRSVEDWNREWLKIRASFSHVLHAGENEEMLPLLRFLDLNQQRLKSLTMQLSDLGRGFSSDALHLARVTNDLGEGVMKVRMLPVSTVFDTFPRLVRDVAREKGKEVDLQVEGGETELDRKVLEEIKDPIIHLLRNSVDHGIESPKEREEAGKPRRGTIALRAFQKGNNIVIEVADDGRGINLDRVKRSALKAGVLGPDDLETISDDEAMQLIFVSGLSTSAMITDISGRGVGMDVVRKNVEGLQGHVDIDSTLGEGTTMTLTLPLTLATTQELLVRMEDQVYGIPISAVERIVRIREQDVSTVEGREAIVVNNDPISLVRLSDVLELPHQKKEDAQNNKKMPAVILSTGRRRIAFVVDSVVGQQESVVKSLGRQLSRVRNVSGATILGSGQVIMTLNPADLVKSARLIGSGSTIARKVSPTMEKEVRQGTILVVDDSLTTRTLERNILEAAGYEVKVATDGAEALSMLQSDECDLVVADILMPHLDGFELTAALKGDPKLRGIPVVLVTSLESREDKERGINVGADAYIVKSTFDQEGLLETVEQLI
jgi:two-component system chemotaxis sensor kinase CheA